MGKIIRAVNGDEDIKISVITGRDAVERARLIHGLTPTTCAVLGRTLMGAGVLGDLMKEEDASVTVRINGGGPVGSVVAVADHFGNVRGYVENPGLSLPLRPDGKLDVGGAVGKDGMLTVSRDIGLREPYIGSTELVSGEIAEDFTRYFAESEQIPAACGLGVLVDPESGVLAAGGFLVQLMPGAPAERIDRLEDNIFYMDTLTTILLEDGPEEVVKQVMKDLSPRILSETEMEYRCYCSRERVAEALISVGAEALDEMAAEGKDISVSCQFCDRNYTFTPDELTALRAQCGAGED